MSCLKSINRLDNRLNSLCGFGDAKGTFGGTSERKLPFEAKKESVMNIQN
jgi:hypothetical protein